MTRYSRPRRYRHSANERAALAMFAVLFFLAGSAALALGSVGLTAAIDGRSQFPADLAVYSAFTMLIGAGLWVMSGCSVVASLARR